MAGGFEPAHDGADLAAVRGEMFGSTVELVEGFQRVLTCLKIETRQCRSDGGVLCIYKESRGVVACDE